MKILNMNLILCIATIIGVATGIITTIQLHNQKIKLNDFNKFAESIGSQDSKISIVISPKESANIKNKKEQEIYWTVLVMSFSDVMKNIKKAGNIAKILKDTTGHNTFVARRGD